QLICAAYDRLGSSTTPAGEATRPCTSASPPIATVRPSSGDRTPTFNAYATEPKALTGTLSSLDSARKPNSPGPSALKLSSLVPIVASCGLLRWRAGYCPPIKASQSGRPSIRLQLSWVNIHSSSCVEKRHDQRSGAPMKRVLCALIFCLV